MTNCFIKTFFTLFDTPNSIPLIINITLLNYLHFHFTIIYYLSKSQSQTSLPLLQALHLSTDLYSNFLLDFILEIQVFYSPFFYS